MLRTKQNAGLSLAVTYTLTQSKSTHCEFLAFFSFLSMITNRVQNNDAMLKYPPLVDALLKLRNTGVMWALMFS